MGAAETRAAGIHAAEHAAGGSCRLGVQASHPEGVYLI